MAHHVIFAAPFFMEATLRFLSGASHLPNVALTVVSQDSADRIPPDIRARLAGHWRIDDGLDPNQLVCAARQLEAQWGPAVAYLATLEQLQVPLAKARAAMGLDGLDVNAARNFRDKSRMKDVLREGGVPCARHALVGTAAEALAFTQTVGYPVVVKPPDGAGGKATYRLESEQQLAAWLQAHTLHPQQPTLFEQFMQGKEYSFDSVVIKGKPVWHSISAYSPTPLEVMENDWIQWCVTLPRDIDGAEFDDIREAGFAAVETLGLKTGLSHMEWFRLEDGSMAISEVGARPPGAQITSLLSYAHNLDFYRAWPRLMVFDEFEPPPREYAVGAAYLKAKGRGRVSHIYGLDEVQARHGSVVVESRLPRRGQSRSDGYEGDGYVIVRHPDTAVVDAALKDIITHIRIDTQ